jgi:hypothetical protein
MNNIATYSTNQTGNHCGIVKNIRHNCCTFENTEEGFEKFCLDYFTPEEHENFRLGHSNGGGFFNRVLKSAGHVLQQVGDAAIYAPLLIFKPAMKSALDEKGISHTNKMDDIAPKFFDNVVKKHGFDDRENAVSGDAVSGIIQGIITFFKDIKDKQKSGQPLTPEEKKLANLADSASGQVDKLAKQQVEDSTASEISHYLFHSWVGPAILVGIAGLVTFLVVRKK